MELRKLPFEPVLLGADVATELWGLTGLLVLEVGVGMATE